MGASGKGGKWSMWLSVREKENKGKEGKKGKKMVARWVLVGVGGVYPVRWLANGSLVTPHVF